MGERPGWIKKMVISGGERSREALSAAGKKGSSHKIQLEDLNAAQRAEDMTKLTTEQNRLYQINSEGDVLSPDESVFIEK